MSFFCQQLKAACGGATALAVVESLLALADASAHKDSQSAAAKAARAFERTAAQIARLFGGIAVPAAAASGAAAGASAGSGATVGSTAS